MQSADAYSGCPPELVPLELTEDTITEVLWYLLGGYRPGGTDSVSLQHWLFHSGEARGEVSLIVVEFTEWIANIWPPCNAYRALMSGQLVGLDKHPGFRPLVIGET